MKKKPIIFALYIVFVAFVFSCNPSSNNDSKSIETTTGIECKATDIFKDYDFDDVNSITVTIDESCHPMMTYKVTDNDPDYLKQLIEIVFREDAIYTTSQFEINEKNSYDFSLTYHIGDNDELTIYFYTFNYVKVNGTVYYSDEMFEYSLIKPTYRNG